MMDRDLEETLAFYTLVNGIIMRGRRLPNGWIEMEPDYIAELAARQRAQSRSVLNG